MVIFWEPEPCPTMENEGEGRIGRQQQNSFSMIKEKAALKFFAKELMNWKDR